MHDGNAQGWRETIDRHHTAMLEELSASVAAEVSAAVERAVSLERKRADEERRRIDEQRNRADEERQREERRRADEQRQQAEDARQRAESDFTRIVAEERTKAADDARRKLSESLNQTLRRIRQTTAEHEALQLVLEDSTACAERAVVVLIENNHIRIGAWRGAALTEEDQDNGAIDLAEAAAVKSCVETGDRLVAMASPLEVSPLLAKALSKAESNKIYLFPITARQTVVAVLLASGEVTPVPIELLCEAAGMKLESLDAMVVPEKPVPAQSKEGFVQIAGAAHRYTAQFTPQAVPQHTPQFTPQHTPQVALAEKATTWESLDAEEQAAHFRAQRMAKVRVAQMRISESDALRRGMQTHDIYGALRISIDTARADYRETYMAAPGMVDYLHLEIVRSLAREDSRLLGQGYPGPIS